jgi:hypothetical protein
MQVSHEVADEDANQIIEDIPTVSDITAPGKLQITYALCISRKDVFKGLLACLKS